MTRIQGLPGALPPGETILWQGRPGTWSLACHLCHVRPVALYFTILLVGTAAASLAQGATVLQTVLALAPFLAATLVALGLLVALAWLIARTTEYTLTTRRVVIRFGVALAATLAIPHRGIAHAGVLLHKDGTGDLPLQTKPGFHVALRRTWPHARPWHFAHPQPMLRCVPGAGPLGTLLARTLAEAARDDTTPPATGAAARSRHPERHLTTA